MRLIAINKLKKSASKYPDVANQIDEFYTIIKQAQWNNLEDVKQTFSTAETVSNFTVMNMVINIA